MYVFGCPDCGFRGTQKDFSCLQTRECFCPKCGCHFEFWPDDEDEDEDEGEED